MCKWGTCKEVEVTIPADMSHSGKTFRKTCKIDGCIADLVKALDKAGIIMRGCCCGHGKTSGSIILNDGRELIIKRWNKNAD